MAEYENTTQVSAPPETLFAYLGDVANLPDYFPRIRSVTPVEGGDKLHTVAEAPAGGTVEGTAWFRTDFERQRVEWGSEGESDYSGYVDVTPTTGGSQVQVHISTARVQSDQVQQGVDEVVRSIKEKVEGQGKGQG